jgi:hypothetical protein
MQPHRIRRRSTVGNSEDTLTKPALVTDSERASVRATDNGIEHSAPSGEGMISPRQTVDLGMSFTGLGLGQAVAIIGFFF